MRQTFLFYLRDITNLTFVSVLAPTERFLCEAFEHTTSAAKFWEFNKSLWNIVDTLVERENACFSAIIEVSEPFDGKHLITQVSQPARGFQVD